MKTLLWLACWFAVGSMAFGGLEKAVKGKSEVELKFDKTQYYLGEPCLVEFVLRNTSDKEISYESGGDYRGADRALRFRVQAVDAQGEPVPDADPANCFGGMVGTRTLNPGEEWRQKLWPLDYLRLTKPGKYTVRITHDLGWCGPEAASGRGNADKSPFVPKDWRAPIGEAQVEFLIPDEGQAEKVLDAISVELKKGENDASRRVPSSRDLAFPVYLPLLKKRALAGEQYFLHALGEIPTKEATLTLLELAENKAFPDASAAAYLLSSRMPFGPKTQSDWNREKRQRLVDAAWDESYTPRARAIALGLVSAFNPDAPAPKPQGASATGYFRNMVASEFKDVDLGARMLAGVGTSEDYETLRAALDKAFKLALNPRRGADVNILDFPAPMPDLIRALDALHERGLELKSHSGDAEIYLNFHWLANTPPPRPKRWLEEAEAFASRYPTQMAFLESIPTPMPPECWELVHELLDARDYGTLMKACQVAGASGDKTLSPDVLAIVRVEQNEWLFRSAADAAAQLGARRELASALAERLTDEKLSRDALQRLIALTVESQPSGGGNGMTREERISAQTAWRELIATHNENIEAGKKFKAGDDEHLPCALFARCIHWTLPDGKVWPEELLSPREKTARLLGSLKKNLESAEAQKPPGAPELTSLKAAVKAWSDALRQEGKTYRHWAEILPMLRKLTALGLTDETLQSVALLKEQMPDDMAHYARDEDSANLDAVAREAELFQGRCEAPMVLVYPAGEEKGKTTLLWEIQGEPQSRVSTGFANNNVEVPELRQMRFPKLDGRWDLEIVAVTENGATQTLALLKKVAATGQCSVTLPPGKLLTLRGVLHELAGTEPRRAWPGIAVWALNAENALPVAVSATIGKVQCETRSNHPQPLTVSVQNKSWPPRPELTQSIYYVDRHLDGSIPLGEKIRIQPGRRYLLSAWLQSNPPPGLNNMIQFGIRLLDQDGKPLTKDGKQVNTLRSCGIGTLHPGIWTYAALAITAGENPEAAGPRRGPHLHPNHLPDASPQSAFTQNAVFMQPVLETGAPIAVAGLFLGEATSASQPPQAPSFDVLIGPGFQEFLPVRWKIVSHTGGDPATPAKLPAGSKLEIRALARQSLRLGDVSAWQTLVTLDASAASGEWKGKIPPDARALQAVLQTPCGKGVVVAASEPMPVFKTRNLLLNPRFESTVADATMPHIPENLRGQPVINGWGPNPRPGSIPYLKNAEPTAPSGFLVTAQTDPAAPGLQQYALEPKGYLELCGARIAVEQGKTYAFCAWLSQPGRLAADEKKEIRLGLKFQDAEGKRGRDDSDRSPETPAWIFRSITVTSALIQSGHEKISRYNVEKLPENAAWLLPELSIDAPCLIEAVYFGEIDPP